MAVRISSPVLVGRAEQLAELDAALAPARRNGPSVILVGGEAGVGKSRLVKEFTARAQGAGTRVLTGGCVELGTDGLPFAPFTAVLRELVRELGADGVAGLLPSGVTRDFARLLPEFGTATAETGDIVARARLFEQMLALLERLADDQPVVLVIEDAHWADRSSRDLLAFLVGRQQILDRVLIVVTYRSDELHRTHPLRPLLAELGRLSWVDRMELPRLDRLHADELVTRLLGYEPSRRWPTRCTAGPRATRCSSRNCCAATATAGSAPACRSPCATSSWSRCGGCPRKPRRCSPRPAPAASTAGTRCSRPSPA